MKKMSGSYLNFFVNHALKGMHFEKRSALVLEMVFSGEMFDEAGTSVGKDFVTKEVQKEITAWRLCKARDMAHQGCLNLQGIEAVRRSQELEKGEQGFIHSKSAVWREGDELLKKVGYPMFSPTHSEYEYGKVFYLYFEGVIRFVLRDNKLLEISIRESVELAFSVDAGSLSQGTSHIFGGCKNVDPRSRKNGKLIFIEEDENSEFTYKNIQSNRNVYMMIMAYSKDRKTLYQNFFSDWFSFINKIKT